MLESKFQAELIEDLEILFPNCLILKNDANYIQGIPDLLILYNDRWAALECKRSESERPGPNQEYYISILEKMSFARFIYPENKGEILYDLQRAFRARRSSRIS